jgi:hypothetical protein
LFGRSRRRALGRASDQESAWAGDLHGFEDHD